MGDRNPLTITDPELRHPQQKATGGPGQPRSSLGRSRVPEILEEAQRASRAISPALLRVG